MDSADDRGRTALMVSVQRGYADIVQALIAAGDKKCIIITSVPEILVHSVDFKMPSIWEI